MIMLLLCGWVQAQIDSLQLIPATVPFSCDFNSQSENQRWILTRSSCFMAEPSNRFVIGTGTSVAGGADKSLYVSGDTTGLESYGANSESCRLFAERILDFGNIPQNWVLELDWKASGNQNGSNLLGGLKVFLRDTADLMPQETPDYAEEYLELAVNDTDWRHIRIPLQNVSGVKTLQFYTWGYLNANARLVPAAIDNIDITPATCDAPQFTVMTVGTNAVFSWPGSETDTFLIIYRLASEGTQNSVYKTVTGSMDTIGGLLPNREYIAWMAKICGSDTSAMYLGTHFTTGCGTYEAPFEEHFSSSQHCWTLDPTFSVLFEYIYTTNYASYTSSPDYFGYFDTARAISPVIDVSDLDNPYLKFSRIQSEYDGKRKDLDLYYREYEEDEWHYIGTFITPTNSNEWKTDSVAIPSHSPTLQLGFFSIQHENQQLSRISLDDIYIYNGPDCEVVSDVAFAGQSGDTAFIHWVCNNPAGCNVRYRTSATAEWVYTNDLGGYAIIEPLAPLTNYEVEVSSSCDSLVWVPCAFTSQVVATLLPYFTNFSDTADRSWQLDNGTCLNHWVMGSQDGYPQMTSALFITHDGTTAGYGQDHYYTVVSASKRFNVSDISTVNIEFDVLCGGNSNLDYLKMFLAPADVEYAASENSTSFSAYDYQVYAANFHEFLSQTGYSGGDYKLNLTQGNVLHINMEMPNPAPNGEVQLVFVWQNDHSNTSNYGIHVDEQPGAVITNVHVWQNDCDVVTDLQVVDIVENHATVTWTPPAVADDFVVEYKLQSDDWTSASVIAQTTDTNFLILNGLLADTVYNVRVRVNCGNVLGVGNWRYCSFNTACAIVVTDSTPYVEDFSTAPDCWIMAVNPDHSWSYLNYNGAMYHQHHYQAGLSDTCPLYSPMMDISAVSHPYLKFSHQQQGDINFHHFDYLKVDYRTSSLSPWQTLVLYDMEISALKTDSIPLPDSLNYIQFAFLSVQNDGGGAIYLDDVSVYNGPSCLPLTSVSVVDVTGSAAAISWVGHSENGYVVRYHDLSDTAWNYATTMDTMFIISNLQGSTTYIVQVSGDCDEPNWLSAQLSTPLIAEDLPYFTDFAPTSDRGWLLNNGDCANYWTMGEVDAANHVNALFVTHDGSTPGYSNTDISVVTAEKLFEMGTADSVVVEFDIRVGGEARYDFIKLFLAPANTEYSTSTTSFPSYAGTSYSTNAFNFTPFFSLSTDQSHSAPYTFALSAGTGMVHIAAVMPNPVANMVNLSQAKVVFLWRNDHLWGDQPGPVITNISVRNNSCAPVSQLTASNVLSTTADISWSPGNGGETEWVLEYKETSATTWNQVVIFGTPGCALTGLTPSTDYEVRVQADCGNGQSIPVQTSFTTTPCDYFCPYTFVLYDSRGDGWNGNAAVHVMQQGSDIASLVAIDHHLQNTPTYDTVQVNLCHNENITLQWTWGTWWMENGVTVLDPDGNMVYTVAGMWNHDSTLTTFTASCPFVAPMVVTDSAGSITQTEATLHGHIADMGELPIVTYGFEWKPLFTSDFTVVTVTGDSLVHSLSGLAPSTDYLYRAFATTAVATTYGNEIVFTTLDEEIPPCPAPTDLHVIDSADYSIAIAWTETGDAEQWRVLYRASSGQMSSDIAYAPSYLITGLQPGTEYQIQVQSVCGLQSSDWTPAVTASTTTGLHDFDLSFVVYPNPAKNVVCVEYLVNNNLFSGEIQVCDVYGKTVVGANHYSSLQVARIDVSGLAAGVYFVRVTTEEGVVTKAFVKQ